MKYLIAAIVLALMAGQAGATARKDATRGRT